MDVGRTLDLVRLDHRLRLWAPTSASHTIFVVDELLVIGSFSKGNAQALCCHQMQGLKGKSRQK